MSTSATIDHKRMPGRATAQGTLRYAARFQGRTAAGHFREIPGGLLFSSIGIGTYLGEPDEAADKGYSDAVVAAIEGGINVVDSAINYRLQRSERSIGTALKELAAKGFARDEIVLCTKAGFLTPDGEMPDDANEYFSREYLEPGVFRPEDIAAGCHCMTPRYLANQLERSLRNLGVECVDVFYLHNPETQLSEISRGELKKRIREAFAFFESAVASSKIGAYGLATWNAFREESKAPGYLSLAEMEEIARDAGGAEHHFRFVQLPVNLAMPEALIRPNQVVQGKTLAMVQAARALGITVVSSAALLQGQLTRNLPPYIGAALGLAKNSEQALQFARSVPGVTTALVGMSRVEHVRANLALVGIEPSPRDQFLKLFEQRG
ncbi:MAG TPA: aldo/keto reductase [Candidatus Acidoferrales bacterium]|jgi:aryl-alcohol dehydrogenase-like predicted oxidoreductase|nr:aldo/keto reductase [Candidatus Acidoferrales bacterium]